MSDTYIALKSAADQFRDAMGQKGISPPKVIEADGQIHRFSSNGRPDDDAGWYVFYDGDIAAGAFGDFRTGQNVRSWVADIGRALSPVETSDFKKKQEEIRAKRDADKMQRSAEAKDKAATILRISQQATDYHPYLMRKGVKSYGLRSWKDLLVVPMQDDSGEIQSLQLISGDGGKKFLSGGKVRGCYFILGDLKNTDRILIAEGYATAATIHEITDHPVIVAYNAGNLPAVAKSIRAQYPNAPIILCADDDWKTEGNPGITRANEAAKAVNGSVIVPDFGGNRPDNATDFNDMEAHLGKDAVTRFFTSHFLERNNDMTHSISDDTGNSQNAFFARPANSNAAPASIHDLPDHKIITGTLTDCGTAPYKFDKKNNASYYVNIKNGEAIRTLWGIDLEKALADSGLDIGDEVAVYDQGKVPVQVLSKIRDAEGNIIREEPRTVMKGAWHVGPLEEYIEARVQTTQNGAPQSNYIRLYPNDERSEREARAAAKHPAAPRSASPTAEVRVHFPAEDFGAVQKIWSVVPHRVASHSESGYDILIDDKRKIHVAKDRIELARKPKHRPDAAYFAACEHAHYFWNGQMEIQGDRQHRIKAWAYAQAYGVEVTNYKPSESDLIEAHKIVQTLQKAMEPGFRRPAAQTGRRPAARLDA